jgi:hypothetical protein
MRRVLCVDPGIVSVGLFGASIDAAGMVTSVYMCENVDMTTPFSTPRNIHTYISRFLEDKEEVFRTADVLVVEKQPVGSAGVPLEIVFRERYGSKCVFIHPATLHKYYMTAGFGYDDRKLRSVEMVVQTLNRWAEDNCPGAAESLARVQALDRKHDCCDACLFFLYYVKVLWIPEKVCDTGGVSFAEYLQQFRYKG